MHMTTSSCIVIGTRAFSSGHEVYVLAIK